jgi:hypothetical protein
MKLRRGVLLAGLGLAVGVAGLVLLTSGRPPPAPPLPNPNGYDDFVKAGSLIPANAGDYASLSPEGLRALVSANAEALRLVRTGLARPCVMPLQRAGTNVNGILLKLTGMKRVVQLLAAEGRLRESDNRLADAASSYLDAIRFGNESSRGGPLIARLVGVACESIGGSRLASLAPRLTPAEARPILDQLVKLDRDRVTWEEVLQSERRFARAQLRQYNPLAQIALRWASFRSKSMDKAGAKHDYVVARERLLAVELALQCYRSDRQRPPARLEELVPAYLPGVPQDPFSGLPLAYRLQGANWLLYSVGTNRVDDGGKRGGGRAAGSPDVFFDSW